MESIKAIRDGQQIDMHRCELCWRTSAHADMDNGYMPVWFPYRHNFHCKARPKPLFQYGKVVCTPGADAALTEFDSKRPLLGDMTQPFSTFGTLFLRHASGDWGDMDAEDKASNDASVLRGQGTIGWGNRLMSQYKLSDTLTIWIMTESDRTVTTILLPEEY